jgi:hypothetical protein
MTISSLTRSVSFIGNGAASVFAFPFKAFQPADLYVTTQDLTSGITTTLVLTTDYSVQLNANQDVSPGGSITLAAGSLATGIGLTITTDIPALQPTEYLNQGGFYPEVLTQSLDRLTILVQQLGQAVATALASLKVWPCVMTTPYTVYTAPGNVAAVFVNGYAQKSSDYTAVGPTITFNYQLYPDDHVDALCTS